MIRHYLIIIACAYPTVSFGGWFGGPSTYDECVLESMKGVVNNVAAQAIAHSCRNKFPEKTSDDPDVPGDVIRQLDGRARMTGVGYFGGHIYNGSQDWTITQITILIAPAATDKTPKPESIPKKYNINLSVGPLTKTDFTVPVDDAEIGEIGWSITKARGHKGSEK